MPDAYQKERYSRSSIRTFVEQHSNQLNTTALTALQIKQETLFKDTPKKPEGPIDILYCFKDEQQKPALGFQQVDGEQDEQEMYLLVYLDPSLKSN